MELQRENTDSLKKRIKNIEQVLVKQTEVLKNLIDSNIL